MCAHFHFLCIKSNSHNLETAWTTRPVYSSSPPLQSFMHFGNVWEWYIGAFSGTIVFVILSIRETLGQGECLLCIQTIHLNLI